MSMSMKEKILDVVRKRGGKGVSFAELAHCIPESCSKESFISAFENGIVWVGSKEFCDAIIELRNEGTLTFRDTSVLVYLCDGMMIDYPVAKRVTKKGYKKPHWIPVVMDLVKSKKPSEVSA